jgi:hypothetical protein
MKSRFYLNAYMVYTLLILRVLFILNLVLTIHTYVPLTLYPRRGSRGISDITPMLYQNYLAMINTADATGGKPIAV